MFLHVGQEVRDKGKGTGNGLPAYADRTIFHPERNGTQARQGDKGPQRSLVLHNVFGGRPKNIYGPSQCYRKVVVVQHIMANLLPSASRCNSTEGAHNLGEFHRRSR